MEVGEVVGVGGSGGKGARWILSPFPAATLSLLGLALEKFH